MRGLTVALLLAGLVASQLWPASVYPTAPDLAQNVTLQSQPDSPAAATGSVASSAGKPQAKPTRSATDILFTIDRSGG